MTVSEKLRLVQGLHSHAEIFGFNWNDGSDWTWHDVACKIADEVDAENAKLRELVRDMWRFGHMSCSKCVVKNDGYCGIGIDEECPLEHSIYDRMRELGVEVDW